MEPFRRIALIQHNGKADVYVLPQTGFTFQHHRGVLRRGNIRRGFMDQRRVTLRPVRRFGNGLLQPAHSGHGDHHGFPSGQIGFLVVRRFQGKAPGTIRFHQHIIGHVQQRFQLHGRKRQLIPLRVVGDTQHPFFLKSLPQLGRPGIHQTRALGRQYAGRRQPENLSGQLTAQLVDQAGLSPAAHDSCYAFGNFQCFI